VGLIRHDALRRATFSNALEKAFGRICEVRRSWWLGLIRHDALRRATFSTTVEKAFLADL